MLDDEILGTEPSQAEISLVAWDFRPVLWILQREDVFCREALTIPVNTPECIDEESQNSAWSPVFVRSLVAPGPSNLHKVIPVAQELRVISRLR